MHLLPKLNAYRCICLNLAGDKTTNPIISPQWAPLPEIGKREKSVARQTWALIFL